MAHPGLTRLFGSSYAVESREWVDRMSGVITDRPSRNWAERAYQKFLPEAENLPPSEHVAVVHGDLHVRQVLAEGRRLTGVIDWVDVCRSDPAIDLSLLWSFVPPEGRRAVLGAYGPLDEAQLFRARVVALSLCAALAGHARAEGLVQVEREALAGLTRALDEPAR